MIAPAQLPPSRIEAAPARNEDEWDQSFDVVVVGFGAAGSAAAIEARRAGARVLVIDRFRGGGATARSGGVFYAGGGSRQQQAAGYEDSPEQMYRYLRAEVGDAIEEKTLRAFCEQSLENLAFLEDLGVPFPPRGEAPKTSYPPNDCTLYFSGNELCPPFDEAAQVAPRGHRVLGKGLTGSVLFRHLRSGVESSGAEIRLQTRALRLLVGEQQEGGPPGVVGLEVASLPESGPRRWLHHRLGQLVSYGAFFGGPLPRLARRGLAGLEARHARPMRIRAAAVILCAGGFIYNSRMVREFAPAWGGCMALGSAGDDGSGIAMGRGAGAAISQMDRCTGWRFINPPVALTHGLLVDREGDRICNEELYGASLGEQITVERGGRAFLVIDAATRRRVLAEIRATGKLNFQSVTALLGLVANRVKGESLEALAERAEMNPATLRATLDAYNERARNGERDPMGKSRKAFLPQEEPPFYAIRCDSRGRGSALPTLTLGGLSTEGLTGRVVDPRGEPIPGLYAAGRSAVGVCSQAYVSGLSIADCIFAGRNAGRHAVRAPV